MCVCRILIKITCLLTYNKHCHRLTADGSADDKVLYSGSAVHRVLRPAAVPPAAKPHGGCWVPVDSRTTSVAVAVYETLEKGCRTVSHSAVDIRIDVRRPRHGAI